MQNISKNRNTIFRCIIYIKRFANTISVIYQSLHMAQRDDQAKAACFFRMPTEGLGLIGRLGVPLISHFFNILIPNRDRANGPCIQNLIAVRSIFNRASTWPKLYEDKFLRQEIVFTRNIFYARISLINIIWRKVFLNAIVI